MFSKNGKNKYKGFSLMEMVVAIFVFSLVMTTATAVFIKVASARKKVKTIQKDVEDARFAMEQMAKTLRTSTIMYVKPLAGVSHSQDIQVYDNSQGRCVEYRISNQKIQSRTGASSDSNDDGKVDSCSFVNVPFGDMVGANVGDLKFDVVKSDGSANKIGKVTISAQICYGGSTTCAGSSDMVRIQTTVSLRDYWEVN
ncbi:MAG: prepilin-type N-terminal cleavage/methylation domain-containing protein [Candidatus Moranbacteria bacterium]|nr:prepilin-type N-terminal cleavage/methylation domain-containing protein [bacterium]MDP1834015.1 prepilin-type N-terminal cleavage/methylation domain-containing protein [Candidatus Moranbacteria bacterium]MDZ4385461.1 prepilin-type N-terminal cleavage/methylation domain-containing protein [Candidatus Moranbacteria bacterium]